MIGKGEKEIERQRELKKKRNAIMKLFYYIRRFWEIPGVERRLFIYALIINSFYFLLTNIFHIKFYMSLLKPIYHNQKSCSDRNIVFKLVRKAINRSSILLPWQSSCLVKSLSFKHLSKNLGVPCNIAIEVMKGSSNLITMHAYVIFENVPIFLYKKNHSGIILRIEDLKQ
jgi:hypothetical protein